MGGNSVIIFVFISAVGFVNCEPKVAEATLKTSTIDGTVKFTETDDGIRVTGTITGMSPGQYGFHVHEIGDVTICDEAGPHFNPEEKTHGGRDHEVRHVGDLGNVIFVAGDGVPGVANIEFVDKIIAFKGTNNILGRSLVLHEQEDDLGKGGHDTSLTTGNAGARVACATIREVHSGVGSIASSVTMVALTMVLMIISASF